MSRRTPRPSRSAEPGPASRQEMSQKRALLESEGDDAATMASLISSGLAIEISMPSACVLPDETTQDDRACIPIGLHNHEEAVQILRTVPHVRGYPWTR